MLTCCRCTPAVARKAPPALRCRNLQHLDGNIVRHVLNDSCWKRLISLLIDAVLLYTIADDEEGGEPVTLTYDRFCKTRKRDRCILTHDRGVGRVGHQPIRVRSSRRGEEWAACTLTQMPDSRWQANFTSIQPFVRHEFESSAAIRQEFKTLSRYAQRKQGRTITLVALICWWAYGKPRDGRDVATHYVCDQARCLNPRHIGWATQHDNCRHTRVHKEDRRKFIFKRGAPDDQQQKRTLRHLRKGIPRRLVF